MYQYNKTYGYKAMMRQEFTVSFKVVDEALGLPMMLAFARQLDMHKITHIRGLTENYPGKVPLMFKSSKRSNNRMKREEIARESEGVRVSPPSPSSSVEHKVRYL